MKSNELRIGNWVYATDGSKRQVTIEALQYIEKYDGIHQARPVPLTTEILEKAGFKKDGKHNSADRYTSKSPVILFEGNGYYTLCFYPLSEIKYLHQLQNLYFSLTGEELNIEL